MDSRLKNDVFKGDMHTQQTQTTNVKIDLGFDVPTELVPLPSNGITYPVEHPFHGVDSVEIKAMTSREEDILTNKVYLKKGTVIGELIKSSLINKNVDPKTLLIGDRTALMFAIRITGYGNEYETEIKCPNCDFKQQYTFDLTTLPIKSLELQPVVQGTNLFAYTLPLSKKTVHFKFLTGRDEEEQVAVAEKQRKLGLSNENNVTNHLQYTVVSIDGVDDKNKIANFIRAMPAKDSLALRTYITKNEPGIDTKHSFECKECEFTGEVDVPIGVTFLWPAAK